MRKSFLQRRCFIPTLTFMAVLCGVSSGAQAGIVYSVTFDDPAGTFASFYDRIRTHTLAAGARWDAFLCGDANLDVVIRFDNAIPTANGRSATSSFVRNNGVLDIFEQGAAGELRTGIDPNGPAPDIEFTFGSNYLQNELWFDPDPFARTAAVPTNRTDAVSVLVHEFGHAFAFNGWRNGTTGALPGTYGSTFDERTIFDGTNFFFDGPLAQGVYGGPVPLTFGNIFHLGNNLPRPGNDLIPDLMNGVVYARGTRYDVSPLDLAIFADLGIASVPEPSSITLLVLGTALGLVAGHHRRRTAPKPTDARPSVASLAVASSTGAVEGEARGHQRKPLVENVL